MDAAKFKEQLAKNVNEVEKHLASLLKEDEETPAHLTAAMQHGSLDGGKRLRPFLLQATSALFNADQLLVRDTSLALECIHCYSLIHDDLPSMDNDELRRGRPTVWKAKGEAMAILAGDALQSLAFELITDKATPANAMIKAELAKCLAIAAGRAGMVGGQVRDLAAEQSSDPTSFADVLQIHAQKTGALLIFACEAGAIIGGADQAARQALKLYGEKLGLAFQLKDDLLDIEGTAEDLGKTPGKDEASGKATLVRALGREKANSFLENLKQGALYALEPFGDKAAPLRGAVHFVCERES